MSFEIYSIGTIFQNVPNIYPCSDGTYSDRSSKRACSNHGGLQSDTPINQCSETDVKLIPLSHIFHDLKNFQNRKEGFSARSVSNIVTAVKENTFKWENFDAITLWLSPDKKLYILSGHSRYEAFKVLRNTNSTVEGRTFETIPARIFRGSLNEAKKIALESNTLSTKETDLERAAFYTILRNTEGVAKNKLKEIATKNEGSNASRIFAYSFLNSNGKTYNALQALETAQETSNATVKVIAKWIGEARARFAGLSNQHEDELFVWLVYQKMYGTQKGQISNENDFLQRVNTVILKRTGVFDNSKPLNLENISQKTPTEQNYDREVSTLQTEILNLEKEIKDKQKDLSNRGATETQVIKLTEGLMVTLTRKRKQYYDVLQRRGNVIDASKNERSLFDSVGKIKYFDL
jgi:hypothetical protein